MAKPKLDWSTISRAALDDAALRVLTDPEAPADVVKAAEDHLVKPPPRLRTVYDRLLAGERVSAHELDELTPNERWAWLEFIEVVQAFCHGMEHVQRIRLGGPEPLAPTSPAEH